MAGPQVYTERLVVYPTTPFWSEIPMPALVSLAAIFSIAIFAVDTFVNFDTAIAVLYVTVVLISGSFAGRRGILTIAAICMMLTLVGFAVQHTTAPSSESIGRCAVSLLAITITTVLTVRIQSTTAALRYQARLLDLTQDAIFVRNMDGTIIFWNRGAEQLYGWSKDQAVGRQSLSLTQTAFPISPEEITAQLLEANHWEGELVDTKRDGTKVTVSSRWSLERDEQGEPASILETNTDIEARKQAQERLAKAQAELAHVSRISTLGELTASIAHEVNQPLAAIVTRGEACLRWLRQDQPKLEEVNRGIERMIGDGRRASEIVSRLRALTKKDGLRTTPIRINDVIEDAIILIPRELSNHHVSLELDLAENLPITLGDRVQLQQVIINLLLNAVQAMDGVNDRLRELIIRSRVDEDNNVLVAVCDTGPGFDAEIGNRLFDAFYTTKADGMGMGLSICRSIIEAHGGRIWPTRNAGHGATFQFTLPAHEELQS